jgi:hypothetical protein
MRSCVHNLNIVIYIFISMSHTLLLVVVLSSGRDSSECTGTVIAVGRFSFNFFIIVYTVVLQYTVWCRSRLIWKITTILPFS